MDQITPRVSYFRSSALVTETLSDNGSGIGSELSS